MNTWKIILKQENTDNFDERVSAQEKKLIINTRHVSGRDALLSTNVFSTLPQLRPHSNISDLLNLALGVYTIDQVVSRDMYGFQGWSRYFKLYVPVSDLDKWVQTKSSLEAMLSFLSGDKWEITFRQKTGQQEKLDFASDTNPQKIRNVSLFSGGLDSFVGAIDLLEEKNKVAFVSHYKRGSESKVQSRLYTELEKIYGEGSFVPYQFFVQPNQGHKETSKEGSSRARSFLFMCLGLTIANVLGRDVGLIIPENGLISLNVPLTGTRLSSHSTRTTHPYYLKLFKHVISILGINNQLTNPYQFNTKGEMMESCHNHEVLKRFSPETLSCSHSEHSRYAGLSPGIHCGYCVPCVIRQAAEKKSKIGGSEYVHSAIKSPPSPLSQSGSDIRAFKLALEKMRDKPMRSIMFDVLGSGPLPFDNEKELFEYVDVYKRGMEEVRVFLKN